MFTGIVAEAARIERIQPGRKSTRLVVRVARTGRGLRIGHSLAVNGACLTAVAVRRGMVSFDVLNETLRRTNLGTARAGDLVNLERPLRANAGLDGHFVLGHVDGRGTIRRYEREGKDYVLEVAAPAEVMRYIVPKGSVAVDGISLTVAAIGRGWFRIWIIPHTHAITNLQQRRAGAVVNLEADIIGKYVDKLLGGRRRG